MSEELARSDKSFRCPVCGSREWGTENLSRPFREWVGHYDNCTFTWPRTDDVKHWEPLPEDWLSEEECEC